MADKKPAPSARQVKQDFRRDAERLLGVDDETLKTKQAASYGPDEPSTGRDRVRADQARRRTQRTREDLAGQHGLKGWFDGVVRFLFGIFSPGDGETPRSSARGRLLGMVVALIVVALGAYLLAERPAMTRSVDDLLGGDRPSQGTQGSSAGGTTKASTSPGEVETKRWLIIRSDNARPQFTIELQGDGPTGPAVWLEPPQAVGAYAWSGEQLEVKLVLKDHRASEGVLFDQHFRLDMTLGSDGGLKGTMYAEDWRYGADTGLELLGMKPYEATGEPK